MPGDDLLSTAEILLDIDLRNKDAVLEAMAARAAQILGRDVREVGAALVARERLGTTALGRGVALPHAQLAGDPRPLMLFARLRRPIDFEARDEERVDLVFAVLWPQESAEGFLPALSGLCRSLRDPSFLQGLRRAGTESEILELLPRPG